MIEEIEVIHQILKGQRESYRLLVERYERPVIRMIRNIINNEELCEDIAQDVFFTAYKKLVSFDPARSNFSTWLFTIARNKSINALKKKKVPSMSELPEGTEHRNPADNLVHRELFAQLDRELLALPPKQKLALILAEFENLPYEQIAQIEGARIGTIKSRINRAKSKLRSALKSLDGDIL